MKTYTLISRRTVENVPQTACICLNNFAGDSEAALELCRTWREQINKLDPVVAGSTHTTPWEETNYNIADGMGTTVAGRYASASIICKNNGASTYPDVVSFYIDTLDKNDEDSLYEQYNDLIDEFTDGEYEAEDYIVKTIIISTEIREENNNA